MTTSTRPSRPSVVPSARPGAGAGARKRSLGLTVLRIVGIGLGAVFGLIALGLAGILIFLSTPSGRRLVVHKVNALTADSFQGRVEIESLGSLGIFGFSGAEATVWDPLGHRVLAIHGARLSVATFAAAKSALSKTGPLTVWLPGVTVDQLEVLLDSDPSGQLELLNAFNPKQPSTPSDPNARGFRLVAPALVLHHVWAHGAMAGAPPLDVDLNEFRGSLDLAPDRIEGDISKLAVVARGIANGADILGSLQAHVRKPAGPLSATVGRIDWQGTAATLGHTLQASLENNRIDAILDAPAVTAESVRALWAASPLNAAGSAHAEVHGVLPALDVAFRAAIGRGSIAAKGTVVATDDKKLDMSLEAHDIDAHELAASAPTSKIGLTADIAAAESAAGAIEGTLAMHFLAGVIDGNSIPPVMLRAKGGGPNTQQIRAWANMVVEEPSAPTRLTLDLTPKGKSSEVTFLLESTVADLARVPQLQHAVAGSLQLRANGGLELATMALRSHATASLQNVVQGANRVDSAALAADAQGMATAPSVDATLQARGIVASGTPLSRAYIGVHGPMGGARVSVSTRGPTTPDLDASADVAIGKGVAVRSLRVDLARAGERASIAVQHAGLVGSALQVDGARIEGLGAPLTLSMSSGAGDLRLKAATQGIDLVRVGRLANMAKQIKAGLLSMNVDLNLARQRAIGSVTLDVSGASFVDVASFASHVELALEGRQFTGKVHADGGDIGVLDLDARKIELAGSGPLATTSWREAWGLVTVDSHADLAKLALLIPPDDLPFGESKGLVRVKGHIGRDNLTDLTPDVALSLKTDGLVLAPNTPRSKDIDGVMVIGPPAWRLAGVDFDVDTSVDGDDGLIDLTLDVRDRRGALARLHATLPHFPYQDVFHNMGRLATDLKASPFDVRFTVPERGLASLPDILKQSYVSGKVQADIHANGTMLAPKLDARGSLHDPHFSSENKSLAMNVDLTANYDGKQAKASVQALSSGKKLLDMQMDADAAVASFLEPTGAAPPWRASLKGHFADFPVSAITWVDDKLIAGQLSGDFSVVDLHKDARADVGLRIDDLRVGNTAYKSANLQLKADSHALDGKMRIEQTDGFAEMATHATATWGTAMAPTPDRGQPIDVKLQSKNFRIAALLPFVEGSLDELDGRLDADAQLQLMGDKGAKLSGSVALTRGLIEAQAGGGEIHDVNALIRFNPDGTVVLDHFTGSGLTGRVQGSASARLDGFELQSAKAVITIPDGAAIPVSGGGSELGDVDGRIEVSATTSSAGRALAIQVNVPNLRVKLPEGSSTDAQALGPIPNVRIGAHRGSRNTFLLVPIDESSKAPPPASDAPPAMQTVLDVTIGNVEVVRGKQLQVDLTGKVHIAGTPAEVTGQISLKKGGTLEVQGKKFEIENGTVTLKGEDPSNPEIVVKAAWNAPDGTVVYAHFIGPLKTGKVTLTSEPTLPQQEIVQLLLFGTPDGQQAQEPSASTANSAIATAGGEASQPLNHALDQIGLGSVTAKVDTSDSANPKPEVEVQIARGISVELAYVLGNPPPGVNPDSILLTVNWRFLQKWSLASTLGDKVTTIFDLLWQKRY